MSDFTHDVVIDAVEKYGQAWGEQNVDMLLDIVTDDAMYLEKPSRYYEGHQAIREYWTNTIVNKQFNLEFRQITEEMVFDKENLSAVVKWEASFDRGEPGSRRMHGLWCVICRFTEVNGEYKICWLEEYWQSIKTEGQKGGNNNNNKGKQGSKGNSKGRNNWNKTQVIKPGLKANNNWNQQKQKGKGKGNNNNQQQGGVKRWTAKK